MAWKMEDIAVRGPWRELAGAREIRQSQTNRGIEDAQIQSRNSMAM